MNKEEINKQIEELKDVIRSVEWVDMRVGPRYCPMCFRREVDGHNPDCRLAKALYGDQE